MRCVEIGAGGAVLDVSPQPAETTACAMVLASPLELASPLNELFTMTEQDAALVSVAIILCWVTGWAVRVALGIGTPGHG
jgi:hypothetical protein